MTTPVGPASPSRLTPSAAEALAPEEKRTLEPHEIDRAQGTSVPLADLEKIAQVLFARQAEFAIYSIYAVTEVFAQTALEIVMVEAIVSSLITCPSATVFVCYVRLWRRACVL